MAATEASAVADASPARAPPDETGRIEDWRDTFVPAPVLRSLPRAPAEPAALPASLETTPNAASAPPAAPAPGWRLERVAVTQGRFVDLDAPGGRRESDVWFAPDRTGYGLFLGVAHTARTRLVKVAKATPAQCATSFLLRVPISARELVRDGGLCVRSTDGVVTAWRVEGVDKTAGGSVLRLRAVNP